MDNQVLRVANIIEEGKLGGPQVRITNIACALKDSIETTVVMPIENSERFRANLDSCGIPYKTFNLSRITKELRVALRYLFFSWYEVFQLILYFRKEKFDLIHVSGGSWQYKSVIAGKLSGRKVIWHLNDTSMPQFLSRIFSIFSGLPDAYIFASERSREYYEPLIRARKLEFVIPAPVDTRLFSPDARLEGDEDLVSKWLGETVIGTVANVNPIKGLDVFIRVASAMNKENGNLQFVVIGSIYDNQKEYFRSLHSLCSELGVDNVEFVGDRHDVRPLLHRFDLYLCTSYAESSPISVWEAMSMGKAIVSTDVGDVSKYVLPDISGEIVDVGDYRSMASRALFLLRNKEKVRSYQINVARVAQTKLDISQCAMKHKIAYEKLVG